MEDPELPREIRHDIPEHQHLLSFNTDDQAALFLVWWYERGCAEFKTWAKEHPNG